MPKERNIDCQSHPFRDVLLSGDLLTMVQNDSEMPRHDVLFPMDESVVIRSFDGFNLRDIAVTSYPNEGFRLREWLKKEKDGHETIKHYHIEVLPGFNPDTLNFINSKIKFLPTERDQQDKGQAFRGVFPFINICPTEGVSFVAADEHYFTIASNGTVIINSEVEEKFSVFEEDGSYRFVTRLHDIEDADDVDAQEYRMFAIGSITTSDPDILREKLDTRVGLGTLRPNDTDTRRTLNSIAILEVNIVQPKVS